MKKQEPLVSVGLTTYQRPKGLKRALKSIASQTYKNLEIIVSENYSPGFDEKEAFIKKCLKKDKRIIYYQHRPNRRMLFNFKFVLEKATGKYFMWAADDDTWASSFISELVHKLEKHPEAGVAMSGFKMLCQKKLFQLIRFNGQNNPNNKNIFGNFCLALDFPRSKYYLFICGLFKRKLLQETFSKVAGIYGGDKIFIIYFSLIASFQYVDKILYYRDYEDFSSSKKNREINEAKIFRWCGEFSSIFQLGWVILFSSQIFWYRKLYIPLIWMKLLIRLWMLIIYKIVGFMIIVLVYFKQIFEKIQCLIIQKYVWSIPKK